MVELLRLEALALLARRAKASLDRRGGSRLRGRVMGLPSHGHTHFLFPVSSFYTSHPLNPSTSTVYHLFFLLHFRNFSQLLFHTLSINMAPIALTPPAEQAKELAFEQLPDTSNMGTTRKIICFSGRETA